MRFLDDGTCIRAKGSKHKAHELQSNFAHARELLEQAWLQLSGDDETSWKSRQAIDLLLNAIATAEFSSRRPTAEIIPFKLAARSRKG